MDETVRLTGSVEEQDGGSICSAIEAAGLATGSGLWRLDVGQGSEREGPRSPWSTLGRDRAAPPPGPPTRLGWRARRVARRVARSLPVPVRRI